MAKPEFKGVTYVLVNPAQIAFPIFDHDALADARARDLSIGDWGGQLVLTDTAEIAKLQGICKDVAKAEWPSRSLAELRFPLARGDDKAKDGKNEWAKGKILLKIKAPMENKEKKAKAPPPVHHVRAMNELVKEPSKSGALYSGAYVAAAMTFKATNGNGSNIKDGVTCYVNSLLIVKDGDRIGGRSASETFKGVVGHVKAENPITGETGEDNDDII